MLRDMLNREGFDVGRRHVGTLMQRMGIEALYACVGLLVVPHRFEVCGQIGEVLGGGRCAQRLSVMMSVPNMLDARANS
jgi:hypothetical protein